MQLDEQLVLIDAESDEALLLPAHVRAKRYTAAQVKKIEWKLDCIVTMIACQAIPIPRIAEVAHVQRHTVEALAAQMAERIGADSIRFADYAAATSAQFMYLARQKSDKAPFKDLMIGHGIARDTAINLRAAGGPMNDPNEGAIELEAENPALKSAREFLQGKENGRALPNAATAEMVEV